MHKVNPSLDESKPRRSTIVSNKSNNCDDINSRKASVKSIKRELNDIANDLDKRIEKSKENLINLKLFNFLRAYLTRN